MLTGVKALAEAAAGAINDRANSDRRTRNESTRPKGITATEAFKLLFGPTHITVIPGTSVGDKKFGKNSGFKNGAFQITLALDRVLGVGPAAWTGVGLVAHEISHNITYADGDSVVTPHGYENTLLDANDVPISLVGTFSVQAGNYNYQYLGNWYYGYDPRNVELTADAIANLALNAFIVGDDGLKRRGHVLDWWNQNIGTFIDNTAACVSGQNSCD